MKTQPATGETYPKSDLFNKADLAGSLQLAMDSGAKRILLPMASASDIPTVPAELFSKFQISFYADPVDAVFKALGVN
ncbi:peptidase [Escherichia coli]|nr:peptidase [Escherichia coli]